MKQMIIMLYALCHNARPRLLQAVILGVTVKKCSCKQKMCQNQSHQVMQTWFFVSILMSMSGLIISDVYGLDRCDGPFMVSEHSFSFRFAVEWCDIETSLKCKF